MKKICIWYFVPAILFVAMLLYFGGAEAFIHPVVIVNLIALIVIGLIMQMGKVWGAYLGIAFGAAWILSDFFTDPYLPSAILCVPLMIYYIYCVVAIKTAPHNK